MKALEESNMNTMNKTFAYFAEDVDLNWIGNLEFDNELHCSDLVTVEFEGETWYFVVYTETHEISENHLLLEQITYEEFEKYSSEWGQVEIHEAVGCSDMYLGQNQYLKSA